MRETMALLIWLDTAVSGIRFGPDREAVRGELYTHLEDKTADLMRIFPDLSPDEARDRALAGMGDAEELKVSLAKVHRPWLGWLWTASRLLVWGSLAVGLLLCLAYVSQDDFAWMEYKRQQNREMQAISRALFEDGMPEWEGERLTVYEPDSQVRLGAGEGAALSSASDCLGPALGSERRSLFPSVGGRRFGQCVLDGEGEPGRLPGLGPEGDSNRVDEPLFGPGAAGGEADPHPF